MMRWPWKRAAERKKEFEEASREWFAYDRRAESEGFTKWTYSRPTPGMWIECQRREWETRKVWQTGNEYPEFNVGDLWWRPWRGDTISGAVIDEKAIGVDTQE